MFTPWSRSSFVFCYWTSHWAERSGHWAGLSWPACSCWPQPSASPPASPPASPRSPCRASSCRPPPPWSLSSAHWTLSASSYLQPWQPPPSAPLVWRTRWCSPCRWEASGTNPWSSAEHLHYFHYWESNLALPEYSRWSSMQSSWCWDLRVWYRLEVWPGTPSVSWCIPARP